MLLVDKYRNLVRQLVQAARDDKFGWTSDGDETFRLSRGNNSLTIQLTPAGSGSRDYFISTYDKSGALMERFGDLDLAYDDANGETNFEFTDMMEEIHDLAKRSAIGAAAVLNELLADIVANDND